MVILAILAVLWAGVIGSWLRERAQANHGDSTIDFRRQLSNLQRTQPGGARGLGARGQLNAADRRVMANRRALAQAEMRRRRRDILLGLVAAAGVTFLLAVATGAGALIAINIICDLAAAGYVALLVQHQRTAIERRTKVRYLPSAAPAAPRSGAASRPARAAMAVGQHLPARQQMPSRAARPARAVRNEPAFVGR